MDRLHKELHKELHKGLHKELRIAGVIYGKSIPWQVR
jgi:hypothetical protein